MRRRRDREVYTVVVLKRGDGNKPKGKNKGSVLFSFSSQALNKQKNTPPLSAAPQMTS